MNTNKASEYVQHLQLLPHPEGGYYRETYRSPSHLSVNGLFPGFEGQRNIATAIYFLIEQGNFSAFHKIKSDETWHFYAGQALEVIEIDESGNLIHTLVGSQMHSGEQFQYTVKAGRWFASRVAATGHFSLVGCTVAPGFDFADFEMAKRDALIMEFPQHQAIILALTRG